MALTVLDEEKEGIKYTELRISISPTCWLGHQGEPHCVGPPGGARVEREIREHIWPLTLRRDSVATSYSAQESENVVSHGRRGLRYAIRQG